MTVFCGLKGGGGGGGGNDDNEANETLKSSWDSGMLFAHNENMGKHPKQMNIKETKEGYSGRGE